MKNQAFLKKALQNRHPLYETEEKVKRTISFSETEKGERIAEEAEDYRGRRMKKGDSVILDFGNHQVGYLKLRLAGAGAHPDAPVFLNLHFAENPAELFEKPEEYHGWICSSWIEQEQIHVDVIPSVFELPRRYAFRYVRIGVLDISSKFDLVIEEASCRAVSGVREEDLVPYDPDCSQYAVLDRIACRTLHNCIQTVFEDGPKRDRRLWLGDLRIQALVNYETYRKNDLVRDCLYLFAALPAENGQVSACVFTEPEPEGDDVFMLDYSLLFVVTLAEYYMATKDKATLRDLWPTALSQIYIAEERLDERDLIRDEDRRGWCFLDWSLDLNKQCGAQGVYLFALKSAACIAQVLEEQKSVRELTGLYESCLEAAKKYLWDEEKQCFVSGSHRQISWASQVWMILGGAAEGEEGIRLLARLEEMQEAVGMVSPYMYHHYVEALILCGAKKTAFEKMISYWGGMAEQGADTFWELYDPENPGVSPYGGTIVNSYCHAWSCGPAYFLRKYER